MTTITMDQTVASVSLEEGHEFIVAVSEYSVFAHERRAYVAAAQQRFVDRGEALDVAAQRFAAMLYGYIMGHHETDEHCQMARRYLRDLKHESSRESAIRNALLESVEE